MSWSGAWALVPAKRFTTAKQRLGGLLDAAGRATLACAMLDDLLALLAADTDLGGTLVVGEDPQARGLCRRHGAFFLAASDKDGLNDAVARGAQALARRGAAAVLVVPSDLPGLRLADLAALRAGLAGSDVALVPAERDGGTNLLASRLPLGFAPVYGPASFARHQAAAAAAGFSVAEPDCPGARADLDRPEDLPALIGCGPRTRSVLARFAPGLLPGSLPPVASPVLIPTAAG
ncbi:2-phospho-L-lactate guanylyltransferase [Xanthobacter autotrophicus DSM 431]|uniref:2-phospho-L-lactate guanylyltransferase n=1 Tax=Xanthobacter nonsaccharivorans TaxID=3119912 RepID=UPI0037288CCD